MTKRSASLKVWAAALLAAVGATAMVVLSFTSPAQAAYDGDLDASFAGDGKLVFDVFGGVDDRAEAVAIQPDGKIVVAGWWCGFGAECNTGTFAIARFNPDGSLDEVFGSGGRTLVAFPNGEAWANGVAIQSDGKIVAAGWRNDDDGSNDADFALARLEADGDLDPSFSGDGKVTTSFGGLDIGEAVAIQGDGKVVVAGYSAGDDGCGGRDFALARYKTDGSLDTSFSGDGKVCTGFGEWEMAFAVAVQEDGGIVAAGEYLDVVPCWSCHQDFALARYNPNGTLDTSFSGDGKVRTGLGGDDTAWGLAIQDDGRIVAAGDNDGDFALARYKTNGSLDGSFDGDGKLSTGFGDNDRAEAVAVQEDGGIVAAGFHKSSGGYDFALARYKTDGSLDTSFSGDGKQTTDFGDNDSAKGAAIQPDGKIVVAGDTTAGGDEDFALARYHAITDNTPPNTTITSGPSGTVNSTSATFRFVSSEPGSKFQCSFDGAAFAACSSPRSYTNLDEGRHFFGVRAIDAAGNIDQSPAQRTFTVDTIAPRVNSVSPGNNATGVAPQADVKATFSEAMSSSSINTDTVRLFRKGTATPIGAAVSYDTQTKTATLNPDVDLGRGTEYKAVVTTGARDLAGNRLDQDQDPANGSQPRKWFFTVSN